MENKNSFLKEDIEKYCFLFWFSNVLVLAAFFPELLYLFQFSATVLELARKQRMNTEVRRNIFCVIMTSEDYLDAFEKLLRFVFNHLSRQEEENGTLSMVEKAPSVRLMF